MPFCRGIIEMGVSGNPGIVLTSISGVHRLSQKLHLPFVNNAHPHLGQRADFLGGVFFVTLDFDFFDFAIILTFLFFGKDDVFTADIHRDANGPGRFINPSLCFF